MLAKFSQSTSVLFFGFVTLTGCETYTSQPLCNNSNATIIPGLEGSYVLNIPSSDFSVETLEIEVPQSLKGHLRASIMKSYKTNRAKNAEKTYLEESSLCQVQGRTISETKTPYGYQQSVVTYDGASLASYQVAFDINALDADSIPSSIKNVPVEAVEGLAFLKNSDSKKFADSLANPFAWSRVQKFGTRDDGDEKFKDILLIDNSQIETKRLWNSARILGYGLTFFKK